MKKSRRKYSKRKKQRTCHQPKSYRRYKKQNCKKTRKRSSRRQKKTHKLRQKKKRGGTIYSYEADEFLKRLDTISDEVSKELIKQECPQCGTKTGNFVCETCNKTRITEEQTKLLKINGNFISENSVMDAIDKDEIDGVKLYTLKEVFTLIFTNDIELMEKLIMIDVNEYLGGENLSFDDLCERTFKNMISSEQKLQGHKLNMSELGEHFKESYRESKKIKSATDDIDLAGGGAASAASHEYGDIDYGAPGIVMDTGN
jgi:hypothetical protein